MLPTRKLNTIYSDLCTRPDEGVFMSSLSITGLELSRGSSRIGESGRRSRLGGVRIAIFGAGLSRLSRR